MLDRVNDIATKLGDFRSSTAYMNALSNNKTISATDYTYDGNGNMYVDKNKDISLIHYNILNLPDSIVVTGKGNIKYTYDAAGNKLKKITTEGAKVTTTLYLFGNFVNDTLQFLPTEEGRARIKDSTSIVYDYFIKDHLGNVRMILTEQTQTDAYPDASLETAQLSNERLYYSKVDSGRVNKNTVSGYPTDSYTNPNDYIQKLNGSGTRVGSGIVLKVMAGDKFNLRVNSWWNSGNSPSTPITPINDLISALSGGVSSVSSGHYSSGELNSSGALNPGATDFLNSQTGYSTSIPKAFVNWVLFDEQFKFVSSSSGFEQVGSSNTFTTHTRTNIVLNKSGYLYVYVSNETPNIDVFFDNLQVTHIRGNLVSEDHYYPYGERMFNLCNAALNFGNPETQRKKFNGIEHTTEFDLNTYDAFYRNLDPQIGRFWQTDPEIEAQESLSPYESMGNNPISNIDPLGDFKTKFGAWWHKLWHGGGKVGKNEYGEWYVTKNKGVEVNDKGEVVVKSAYYYGKGRNKYSTAKEELLKEADDQALRIQLTLEGLWDPNLTPEEARQNAKSYLNLLLPNATFKPGTLSINFTKITANNLQELKVLIKQLSKPGSELTQKELNQLEKLVERFGGKLRYDLSPVKGKILKPHVQVEGLGSSIESRHIWLSVNTAKKLLQ